MIEPIRLGFFLEPDNFVEASVEALESLTPDLGEMTSTIL